MGACVTEAEGNTNDRAELKDKGDKEVRFFPPTAMVWTTIQKAQMRDIFLGATGVYPEEEEEEFLCRAEAEECDMWPDETTGTEMEVNIVEGGTTLYRPEYHDMQSPSEEDAVWQQENNRCDSISQDEEEIRNEERQLWRGQTSRGRWSNQKRTKSIGEICKVDMRPESQTQFKRNAEDNKMKWLEVRTEVIKITQERLKQLSPTGDCQMSEDQRSYIESLTDPQVTVVVCQGGAGTGKTYTAMSVQGPSSSSSSTKFRP